MAEAPRLPADLQKVLDEVDSYVSLGFVDDAKDALREISSRYPGHAAIAAKIAELGIDLEEAAPEVEARPRGRSNRRRLLPRKSLSSTSAPPAPSRPPPEPALPEEPEMPAFAPEDAAECSPRAAPRRGRSAASTSAPSSDELFGAQSAVEEPPAKTSETDLGDAGLADIFKEFKKGVDKQLGKEDYDTRYNLGIAYKEMGLVDEAIAEFQLAAKDENRILECSSMLGICFMEKGMPKLAVKWFEKGLKAAGRSPEEYQGLRYDLAMAHEAAGEADTALELFSELYGEDASFRDVAAKVRELKAARARAPLAEQAPSPVPTFLSVLSAFLVGVVLAIAPWTTLWETNYLLQPNSLLRAVVLHVFTRGAVTGLGLVEPRPRLPGGAPVPGGTSWPPLRSSCLS